MTRFARAKGSKASNERVPETATPWDVMKQDLQKTQEESKNKKHREQFHEERQKKYDEFIKETESKTEKKWAEFPKPNLRTIRKNKKSVKITEKGVTDDMIQEMCHPDPEVDGQLEKMTKKIEQALIKERVNKNNMNKSAKNDDAPQEASTKVSPKKVQVKKAKNKKQALKIASIITEDQETMKIDISEKKETQNKTLYQKNDRNKLKQNKEKNKIGNKNDKNKKLNKNRNETSQQRKYPKERDNLEHKRRKPFSNNTTVIVNGEEQAVDMYAGFPVLKSDYDRLVELRKSFISKGIPHSEVQVTMKLERRKAEKKLFRLKKVVCFQCRKFGHLLSECPQLHDDKSLVENAGTGLCFKCGSGEHNYKECKVNKGFSFARCFICKEQGHISRECPDNPKGLYPNGGACKLCGDVTHLKKDCPQHVEEQQANAVFLNTISGGNIESIDDDIQSPKKNTPNRRKIVKF